ncbi:hypothetical protein RhiirA1_459210 [Rhizophagus irregularis]|uniref:Uncharacterized protein n=1 Tax=Rhizophagus irregularis TaxID=588596 RepID=A0A2I1E3E9_9GLOM|nr:hypothetical protein RhiirA1_459210 [Rhizophagus irregularis]PKY16631.1 hypothetical protein RhiirB3_429091 [Rhizophagus irregularis]
MMYSERFLQVYTLKLFKTVYKNKGKTQSKLRSLKSERRMRYNQILEKPGVSNHLEYLWFLNTAVTDKQATHKKWVEILNNIWKHHPIQPITNSKTSVKNYQDSIFCAILCFGITYEIKSQAVSKFWTHIEKAKLGNKLFIHFNRVTELVENRNKFLESEYDELSSHSGFDNDEEPNEEEYFPHIIDLDNVTE